MLINEVVLKTINKDRVSVTAIIKGIFSAG